MARKSVSSYFSGALAFVLVVPVLAIFGLQSSVAGFKAKKKFVVEVCENGNRFQPDLDNGVPEPAAGGLPAYGNEFITQGLIYPKGTLVVGQPCPNESLAIGTWTCRGWHAADAATTVSGPSVITTQNFDFYSGSGYVPGRHMIVTDGFELADGAPVRRPVVGGTGKFKFSRGDSTQRLIDFSGSPPGVKLIVKFGLK